MMRSRRWAGSGGVSSRTAGAPWRTCWTPPLGEGVDDTRAGLPPGYRLTAPAAPRTCLRKVRQGSSLVVKYTPAPPGWQHRITTNLSRPVPAHAAIVEGGRRRRRACPAGARTAQITTTSPSTTKASAPWTPSPDFRAAVSAVRLEAYLRGIAATWASRLGTVRSRIHRGRAQRGAIEHRRTAGARPAYGARFA